MASFRPHTDDHHLANSTPNPRLRFFFGGSFNPIHHGHLAIIRYLSEHFPEACIHILPHASTPHKPSLPDPDLRVAMLRAGLQDLPSFHPYASPLPDADAGIYVDTYEIGLSESSVTAHTAAHMAKTYPGEVLFWVMGADVWLQLPLWTDTRGQLTGMAWLSLVHAMIIPRQYSDSVHEASMCSSDDHGLADCLVSPVSVLPSAYTRLSAIAQACHAVVLNDCTTPMISATHIRSLIARHASTQGLLPQQVRQMLDAYGLYR